MTNLKTHIAALQWQLEAGVDIAIADEPVDSTAMPEIPKREEISAAPKTAESSATTAAPLAASETKAEAIRIAKEAATLDELKAAIANFDGIGLKKTATNLVFGDGNPQAPVMIIGETPNADEDRQGLPFAAANLQLLDKMMGAIHLERNHEDAQRAFYMANVLNFRPPGNRSPTAAEIALSLPFIEKQIALIKPKLLIFMGSITAKSLLNRTENLSKLRGDFHSYAPITKDLFETQPESIPAIVTHHPATLLRNPAQKKQAWQDLLLFQKKHTETTKDK